MQEVVINPRTKIYIAVGADPEEAKKPLLGTPDAKASSAYSQENCGELIKRSSVFQ